MPVWLPRTAAQQPHVALVSWAAFEVLIPKLGKPTLHVAGVEEGAGGGRVSSPVAEVDSTRRSIVTRSGRVYRLGGPPGLGGDAEYVWQRWVESWNAQVLSDAVPMLLSAFDDQEARDGDASK